MRIDEWHALMMQRCITPLPARRNNNNNMLVHALWGGGGALPPALASSSTGKLFVTMMHTVRKGPGHAHTHAHARRSPRWRPRRCGARLTLQRKRCESLCSSGVTTHASAVTSRTWRSRVGGAVHACAALPRTPSHSAACPVAPLWSLSLSATCMMGVHIVPGMGCECPHPAP